MRLLKNTRYEGFKKYAKRVCFFPSMLGTRDLTKHNAHVFYEVENGQYLSNTFIFTYMKLMSELTVFPELKKWLQGVTGIAVLGVGSRIRGDDAVGPVIIDHLKGKVPSYVVLFDCETVPESFTGPIRRMAPSHVLIIDAAEMGLNPGGACVVNSESILESFSSTHALSLAILSDYITSGIGAKVLLLGIQPKDIRLGMEMTPELTKAAQSLSQNILSVLLEVGR